MKSELIFNDAMFVFETVMRVRNSDVDSGQYLTVEALTELLCEARSRFLYSKGIKQIDSDHQGLIVEDLQMNIISLARAREELLFEAGIEPMTADSCDIIIKVKRMHCGSLVAKSRQRCVNYDYRLNKVTTISNLTMQALDQGLAAAG